MIKREYFAHGRKNHNDGKNSYSWWQFTFTITSWLPASTKAYLYAYDKINENIGDISSEPVEIIAFNRI